LNVISATLEPGLGSASAEKEISSNNNGNRFFIIFTDAQIELN
jgi:hypothetical protein